MAATALLFAWIAVRFKPYSHAVATAATVVTSAGTADGNSGDEHQHRSGSIGADFSGGRHPAAAATDDVTVSLLAQQDSVVESPSAGK